MKKTGIEYTPNCELKPGMELPPGVERRAAIVEYHGGRFQGFQKQASTANTIQTCLEAALSKVANTEVTLVCAGRTDAGVHAGHQVIHFDTAAVRPDKAWVQGVNLYLPRSIRILWSQSVSGDFHARFCAVNRSYRYVTLTSKVPSALLDGLVTWRRDDLDVEQMSVAAASLLGEHDFSAFRASQCQAKNPVRRLEQLRIERRGGFLVTEVRANAFLHHMVRNIMGVLFEVGRGARPAQWAAEVLAGRDRTQAAATAPAAGLYLAGVGYPPEFELPGVAACPAFLAGCLDQGLY